MRFGRLGAFVTRLRMYWVTVALFAVVLAYIDGFWVTSLQGAVGAIERRQPPFQRWLRDSTLMLPVYVVVVVVALLLARRWVGQRQRTMVRVGAATLLVVIASAGLGIVEVSASSAWDYHLQARHLEVSQHNHQTIPAGGQLLTSGGEVACDSLCAAKRDTFTLHVHAVRYASIVMLLSNLVLVLWAMALRSDRLWRQKEPPDPAVVLRSNVKTKVHWPRFAVSRRKVDHPTSV